MSPCSKNNPPSREKVARLLSVLLLTELDELDGYRVRCLGRNSDVDTERLVTVQELLQWLGATLLDNDEHRWSSLLAMACTERVDESHVRMQFARENVALPFRRPAPELHKSGS